MMKIKRKNGFTIVELVIVIAVVAILSAILVPTISKLVKQAHVTSDTQLVRNLNTSLAMDTKTVKHANMQQALDAAAACGYDVGKINASAMDNMILWDSENDVFCYRIVDEDGNVSISYIPESVEAGKELAADSYKLWIISDQVHPNFSTYYTGTATTINTSKGFDAGVCTTIETINYTQNEAAQEIVIRTNSATTALNVDGYVDPTDSTKGDVINHYGSVGELKIIKCATASFHEYGKAAFASISRGRIVLEKESNIEQIHINANNSNSFDQVIIKDAGTENLPKAITRDVVTVAANASVDVVTVVSADNSSEVVKVYGSGEVGTTEKTETQNTTVSSALGTLVLDSGVESKALTETEKEISVSEAINNAKVEEFSSDEGRLVPANAVVYNVDLDKYYSIGTAYATGMAALRAALDEANSKNTIVLMDDITINQGSSARFAISKSVFINGANHTVTTNGRGFGIGLNATEMIDVKFQDITIINSTASGRGIDTRGNLKSLILENVVVKTPKEATQPLTIGGNQAEKALVTIKNSVLETTEEGKWGYAITTFNPVDMTIIGSTIKGWACLNIKGPDGSAGSSGSTFKVGDSHLVCKNVYPGQTNAYCLVKMEDDNVNVEYTLIGCRFDIIGESNYQGIVAFESMDQTPVSGCSVTIGEGNVVNFNGEHTYFAEATTNGSALILTGGTYNKDPSEYVSEGYTVVDNGDSTYTIVPETNE